MAYALAAEAAALGAKVSLISGPVNLNTPEKVTRVDVITANEMLAACLAAIADADVFIGVAAVADYRPQQIANDKIKKDADQIQLTLVKNPDIIREIAKLASRPLVVGFAAETSNIVANGEKKLANKGLDLLFANDASETFNSDTIAVTAISATASVELAPGNKHVVARNMLQLISDQLPSSD